MEYITDLVLLLEFCSSVCYHGTCDVECHCSHGSDCVYFNGEYTDEFDVCRRGCRSGWDGIGCQIGNVAVGKDASQIHMFFGANFWVNNGDNSPGNCVDGISSRSENQNSCCSVAAYSYWEVSLGDMYVVNQLKLHRSDEEQNSVRNTNIRLYKGNQLEEELNTGHRYPPEIRTLDLNREVLINRIEVQKNSQRWHVRMCEVEAFGYQHR